MTIKHVEFNMHPMEDDECRITILKMVDLGMKA
jgi:hypothetical protein